MGPAAILMPAYGSVQLSSCNRQSPPSSLQYNCSCDCMCGCVILDELEYLCTKIQIPDAINTDKDTWTIPNRLIILKFN